ncbi:hypothetical protein CEXT_595131 [Caerostris extrusa]|uniref:Uncharacterized protein n=1 Tax=Caerostris extrusa TaxID=172846 RepID=A0AAV4PH28_CAEEX|nr:hypothetical protein CEXT_595131 [Caerostris extrusa]
MFVSKSIGSQKKEDRGKKKKKKKNRTICIRSRPAIYAEREREKTPPCRCEINTAKCNLFRTDELRYLSFPLLTVATSGLPMKPQTGFSSLCLLCLDKLIPRLA